MTVVGIRVVVMKKVRRGQVFEIYFEFGFTASLGHQPLMKWVIQLTLPDHDTGPSKIQCSQVKSRRDLLFFKPVSTESIKVNTVELMLYTTVTH